MSEATTGAATGAASGAAMGTMVNPGVGTAVGAVIGGVAGYLQGSGMGKKHSAQDEAYARYAQALGTYGNQSSQLGSFGAQQGFAQSDQSHANLGQTLAERQALDAQLRPKQAAAQQMQTAAIAPAFAGAPQGNPGGTQGFLARAMQDRQQRAVEGAAPASYQLGLQQQAQAQHGGQLDAAIRDAALRRDTETLQRLLTLQQASYYEPFARAQAMLPAEAARASLAGGDQMLAGGLLQAGGGMLASGMMSKGAA